MTFLAEVHDQRLCQLHSSNEHLMQEKAEAAVMVKQVAAVLTQLDGVWMDLPPNVAASVQKLLARQRSLGLPEHSTTEVSKSFASPDHTSTSSHSPASEGSAADRVSGRWLSFGETFGSSPMPAFGDGRTAATAESSESQRASKDTLSTRGWPEASEAEILLDLPGGNTLVAEMDMLCGMLQRGLKQTFEELRTSMETLRAEVREQQKKVEDLILRGEEAQKTELDLCGAQLSELKESIGKIWSDEGAVCKGSGRGGNRTGGTGVSDSYGVVQVKFERCRADWTWCRNSSEQRCRASFEHAKWLEEYTQRRLDAVQAALDARQREFNEDLKAAWDRKALLLARLREHFGKASESNSHDILHEQHRKELQKLEHVSVGQISALVQSSGEAEEEHMLRLKEVIVDMKGKAKSADTLFNELLARCRNEMEERVHDSLASVYSAHRLDRLAMLSSAWVAWHAEIVAARFGGLHGKLVAEVAQKENLCDKLGVAEASCHSAQVKVRGLQESMDSYSGFQQERDLRSWTCQLLQAWAGAVMEAKQQCLVSTVANKNEEVAQLGTALQASRASTAGFEAQLRRAEHGREQSSEYMSSRLTDCLLASSVFAMWVLLLRTSWANIAAIALEEERAEATCLRTKRDSFEAAAALMAWRATRRGALSRILHYWREVVVAEGGIRDSRSSSFAISRLEWQATLTAVWTSWRAELATTRLDGLQGQLAIQTASKEHATEMLEATEVKRSLAQERVRSLQESMDGYSLRQHHRDSSQWLHLLFRDWAAVVASARQTSLRGAVARADEELASVERALQAATCFMSRCAYRRGAQLEILHLWRESVIAEGGLRDSLGSSFAISRLDRQATLTAVWTAWRGLLDAIRVGGLQNQLAIETASKEQVAELLESTEAERSAVQAKVRNLEEGMDGLSLVQHHRVSSHFVHVLFREWAAVVDSAKQLYLASQMGDRMVAGAVLAAWVLSVQTSRTTVISAALEHEQAEVRHLVWKRNCLEAASTFLFSRADRLGALLLVLRSWREVSVVQALRQGRSRALSKVVDRMFFAQSAQLALLGAFACWKENHLLVLKKQSETEMHEQAKLSAAYRLQMKTHVLKLLDGHDSPADMDTADSDSDNNCDALPPSTPSPCQQACAGVVVEAPSGRIPTQWFS